MPSSISTVRWVGVALVVDVERSAAIRQRAVVDHRDAARRDALADAAGERARALAVEVALKSMADRFVQQDAGPARTRARPASRRPGPGAPTRLTSAWSTALCACSARRSSRRTARSCRPPPPENPCSRRPCSSTMTVTESCTSGRTSAASTPSLRATSTTSYSAPTLAITCLTRGSRARASCSMRSSRRIFSAASSDATGSSVP